MNDLHHLNKQMTKTQIDADKARQRAEIERQRAYSFGNAGNDGQMALHMAAAEKLEHDAREYDDQRVQAENEKASVEAQISDLEQERDRAIAEHNARLSDLTKQIDRLKGTSMSL